MPKTKTEGFSPATLEMAGIFKALAHPARVAILQFLLERNACVCGSIVDALPLSQATVSQHLAELKLGGLIKGTIDGPRVCYCIDTDNWEKAKTMVNAFFSQTHGCANC
jgi:ArsR family transcriptional regulator, arsenate/arsenite/antimonite-responsive transcriptional repressor